MGQQPWAFLGALASMTSGDLVHVYFTMGSCPVAFGDEPLNLAHLAQTLAWPWLWKAIVLGKED